MNAHQEIVKQRFSLLEIAEVLGNVSEACQRRGISRTEFYEYDRRRLRVQLKPQSSKTTAAAGKDSQLLSTCPNDVQMVSIRNQSQAKLVEVHGTGWTCFLQ